MLSYPDGIFTTPCAFFIKQLQK